jgi:hypothetical protein
MAIGDEAIAAGYPLVPNTGAAGEVKLGAQEINRTRDFVAEVKNSVLSIWPVTKGGTGANNAGAAKTNLGISFGTGAANDANGGAVNGNLYFKIVS